MPSVGEYKQTNMLSLPVNLTYVQMYSAVGDIPTPPLLSFYFLYLDFSVLSMYLSLSRCLLSDVNLFEKPL